MNKLYHIKKEIASGAAEFVAMLTICGEVFIFWEIAAAIANGTPIPAWCGAAACALASAMVFAAARAVLCRLPRRRAARCIRYGVIDADTICRIMEGTR